MTKISGLPLREDVWEKIFKMFIDTLADIKEKKAAEKFVYDFFSPTERIMFAKRLACAVLIAKGHSYESIKSILKLSPNTIAKVSTTVRYEGEGLNDAVESIFRKQARRIVWKEIEELLDLPSKGSLKSPSRLRDSYTRRREVEKLKDTF